MHAAFAAGCASFSRDGYRFGDPMEFLHPAGHDHWQRPDFRGCPHCSPPVQGKVVLLYAKADSSSKAGGGREGWHGSHDGESRLVQLVEVYGRDVIRTDKRSWERHWRGLAIGMRIVQRMSKWSTTAESVRDLHKAHLREAERARERDRGDGGRPGLVRQRSADATMASDATLLYPELGVASQYAKPGAFRRAHILRASA